MILLIYGKDDVLGFIL